MTLTYDTDIAKKFGATAAIVYGYIGQRIREVGVPLKGVSFARITKRGCAEDLNMSVGTVVKALDLLMKEEGIKMLKLPHDSGFWYTTKVKELEEGGMWNGD